MLPPGEPAETTRPEPPTSASRVALLALVAVWFAFAFPALGGKVRFPAYYGGPVDGLVERVNPELGDAVLATYQWRAYMTQRWERGSIPLWDPHRFAGAPFAANIVIGLWYPPTWAYALPLDAMWTFTILALATLLGALLLAYWFLRLLRLHPYAACLGAIGFACSGFMMKWSAHESIFGAGMWLPLALGGMELIHRRKPAAGIAACAAGLALSVLAGHAQVTLYVWYATAAWGAVAGLRRAVRGRGRRVLASSVLRGGLLSVAPFLIATGLAAVQIVPSAELAGRIIRQQYSYQQELVTRILPERLPTILIPDYLGNPVDGTYGDRWPPYLEMAVYPGVALLPLAAVGLADRRRRLTGFFAGMVAIGLLAALGTPFLKLLLLLPGLDRVYWIDRYVFFVNVGLACLAALGLDLLIRREARSLRVLGASTAVVVALAAGALTVRGSSAVPEGYLTPRGIRAAAFASCAGALCLLVGPRRSGAALALAAVAAADLWMWGFPLFPYQQPRPLMAGSPAVDHLRAVEGPRPRYGNMLPSHDMAFNAAMVYGLYDVGGYDIAIPRNIVELVSLAQAQQERATANFLGPFRPEVFASPIMDLLGVRTVAGPPTAPPPPGTVADGVIHPVSFARNLDALPAAFVAPCWEVVPQEEVLPRLAGLDTAGLRGTAYVGDGEDARRALGGRAAPHRCDASGTASIDRYEPEFVGIDARTDTGGVLVLTDTWYPGWEATVDGEPVPVLEVDHALRGVALPPGSHRVEFRFRPLSFVMGAWTSVATLAGLGLWAGRRAMARSPRPEVETAPLEDATV